MVFLIAQQWSRQRNGRSLLLSISFGYWLFRSLATSDVWAMTVAAHFCSNGHTLRDLNVIVVDQLQQNDAVLRKNRESRWIRILKTEAPNGMNLQVDRLWNYINDKFVTCMLSSISSTFTPFPLSPIFVMLSSCASLFSLLPPTYPSFSLARTVDTHTFLVSFSPLGHLFPIYLFFV